MPLEAAGPSSVRPNVAYVTAFDHQVTQQRGLMLGKMFSPFRPRAADQKQVADDGGGLGRGKSMLRGGGGLGSTAC